MLTYTHVCLLVALNHEAIVKFVSMPVTLIVAENHVFLNKEQLLWNFYLSSPGYLWRKNLKSEQDR